MFLTVNISELTRTLDNWPGQNFYLGLFGKTDRGLNLALGLDAWG
jgi:hypothetical protein